MSARITKSRDPILSALRAEYLAALDFSRLAFDADEWDAAIDRVNKARVAVNKREELFTPKRERKARRKRGEQRRIFNRIAKCQHAKHPLSTLYFTRELKRCNDYYLSLIYGHVHRTMRQEFFDQALICIDVARYYRKEAAHLGRRLP